MVVTNAKLGGVDIQDEDTVSAVNTNDTTNEVVDNIIEINKGAFGDILISGCVVSQQTVADQTVQISAGKILIDGLRVDVSADASVSLSAAPTTSSYSRIDLITVSPTGSFTVTDGIEGNQANTSTAIPAGHIKIADVFRYQNDNTIDDDVIDNVVFKIGQTKNGEWTLHERRVVHSVYSQEFTGIPESSTIKLVINNASSTSSAFFSFTLNGETSSNSCVTQFVLDATTPTLSRDANSDFKFGALYDSGLKFNAEFFIPAGANGGRRSISGTCVTGDSYEPRSFIGGQYGAYFTEAISNLKVTGFSNLIANTECSIEIWVKE